MKTKFVKRDSYAEGVTSIGKYRARIMFNGVEIRLGHYETLEEATKARKQAECKYFGEYARDEK